MHLKNKKPYLLLMLAIILADKNHRGADCPDDGRTMRLVRRSGELEGAEQPLFLLRRSKAEVVLTIGVCDEPAHALGICLAVCTNADHLGACFCW